MSKLNGSKYCNVFLTIQLNITHLFRRLNDQTVIFQTIKFSISTQFRCKTDLFDQWIGPYQMQPLRERVDQGVIPMKGYSASPKAPALLDPLHQIVYFIRLCILQPPTDWAIKDIRWEVLALFRDAVGVFCSLR